MCFLAQADRLHRGVQHLIPRHSELVLQMNIGSGDENMDARILGLLHRLQRSIDIPLLRPRQAENPRPRHFLTNAHHRVKIALRRSREARLDDIDAQLFQLPGNNNFLFHGHARAGRLFAIPQRRIKNSYSIIVRP